MRLLKEPSAELLDVVLWHHHHHHHDNGVSGHDGLASAGVRAADTSRPSHAMPLSSAQLAEGCVRYVGPPADCPDPVTRPPHLSLIHI